MTKAEKECVPCNKNRSEPLCSQPATPLREKAEKMVLTLSGLDCAACAAEIEKSLRQLPGVENAEMNFASEKLAIEVSKSADASSVLKQVKQTIRNMEPEVRVSIEGEHSEEENDENSSVRKILFGISAALFLIGLFAPLPQTAKLAVFLGAYLLVGGKVVLRAIKNIAHGRLFDENFLMSVATIGAFCIGEYAEGVAVMLFYEIGEYFQDLAVERSRKSITSLMDIRPDYANLKMNGETRKVSPEEVQVGSSILVRPGEKVPLDGVVEEGSSTLDTSALTGESMPRSVKTGDEILSGCVNESGVLTVRVTKAFGESTVTKILDLVQNASSQKAPTENFITKFARIYTPVVVFSAIALAVIPPLLIPGAVFSDWLSRALTFLVVSCPCALVISIPLSFFGGIGGASKQGILIKGSNYLEALNSVSTVVFDKTGTLTKGKFSVTRVLAAENMTQAEVLKYAAYAEFYSGHPIAASIRSAYGTELDESLVSGYQEISGKGIRATVDGKAVLAGNAGLMEIEKISFPTTQDVGTVIYLAVDGHFAGSLIISDEVKQDSAKAISGLKSLGICTSMLTGDSKSVGENVAKRLGLDSVFTNLLPQQKVTQMEQFKKETRPGSKLVFVGDGLNDAPVLAQADVGVAMGGIGSDAAIEAADVVLMTDEPSKLLTAIRISKQTHKIVWENIIFALAVKLVILVLAAFGIATMWAAVFGDVGVTILAVMNSVRAAQTHKI